MTQCRTKTTTTTNNDQQFIIMGSKKGKGRQRSGCISKSARAARVWDINEWIHEAKLDRNVDKGEHDNQPQSGGDARTNTTRSTHSLSASNACKKRGNVLQGHLRGILRERLLSDRIEDMHDRRRRRRGSDANTQALLALQSSLSLQKNNISQGKDFCMKEESYEFEFESSSFVCYVPSLQMLSAKVVAQCNILHSCIIEHGCDVVYNHLIRSLNPSVISYMSLHCTMDNKGYDGCDPNEMMYVLGRHSALSILCLSFTGNSNCKYKYDDDISDFERSYRFTDEGLLSIVPAQDNSLSCIVKQIDSWEDLDDENYSSRMIDVEDCGCIHLETFILSGATDNITAHALTDFLQRCPGVRHLALNQCLDDISGTSFLLNSRYHGRMLGYVLCSDIKTLDLSFCEWLTDDTLMTFICRELNPDVMKDRVICKGLDGRLVIHVVGCWQISAKFCNDSLAGMERFSDYKTWLSIYDDSEILRQEREWLKRSLIRL